VASQILFLFGNGHPAKIVKLAGDSDEEAVNGLLRYGLMRMNADKSSEQSILGASIGIDSPPPIIIEHKSSIEELLGAGKNL
jgi:hypothetical protein